MLYRDCRNTIPSVNDITEREVHVWYASTKIHANRLTDYRGVLSSDEISRANRFHFDRDRNCFIIGRGILRIILARYLGSDPKKLDFYYNRYGKPYLAPTFIDGGVQFNVSHSGELIIYAITAKREIGVDIEVMRSIKETDGIIDRFCSELEKEHYREIPKELKHLAFLLCCTRKEAFIKALGDGLTKPLDEFAVSLIPNPPGKLISIDGSREKAANWSLTDISFCHIGYVSAVAVQGHGWHLYSQEFK